MYNVCIGTCGRRPQATIFVNVLKEPRLAWNQLKWHLIVRERKQVNKFYSFLCVIFVWIRCDCEMPKMCMRCTVRCEHGASDAAWLGVAHTHSTQHTSHFSKAANSPSTLCALCASSCFLHFEHQMNNLCTNWSTRVKRVGYDLMAQRSHGSRQQNNNRKHR